MLKITYHGIYASYIEQLIAFKRSVGYKYDREARLLAYFDRFTIEEGETNVGISKELSDKWCARIGCESETYRYSRCVCLNQLSSYLCNINIRSFIRMLPKYRKNFNPYVFSKIEMENIFMACDKLATKDKVMDSTVFAMPILIRFLYGTGLRINEALDLRNKDFNLIDNYIIVKDNKNGFERNLPLSDSLARACKMYEYRGQMPIKTSGDTFFFVKMNGERCHRAVVYSWYRRVLTKAGIAFTGGSHNHSGPRIHDIRHTTACHALAKMIDEGMDLYCSLPIISTYLGHQSLKATDLYVRLTAEMYPGLIKNIDMLTFNVFPRLDHETN
ncbi:tyrosine-type recombinase/integrase [Mucilaginibacter sp. UR6-11]|uniref:tyrosine-type recombinase/integrase n=1 Tax=Mucilaginibacter sp. UR6-11 TaxID=1435644 RepID=UPI001E43F8E0|nr:tyrosine-type recombinase/integrase [Mucilaginibacter sp. UR6-11]MCC8426465.1 tyrosine-type recombinase/integrase [Mucilaginibacter sp. UR6-11]